MHHLDACHYGLRGVVVKLLALGFSSLSDETFNRVTMSSLHMTLAVGGT